MALDKILTVKGRAVPFMGDDIDTDRIIPARFMKCVTFDGLGEFAFFDSRKEFENAGKVHPVDDPRFTGASILISGANFGCGSSREHAPQSLYRAGFRAIVAETFAEIFFGNSTTLGIPCVSLPREQLNRLAQLIQEKPGTEVTIDLTSMQLTAGDWKTTITLNSSARQALTEGKWDPIAELLEASDSIQSVASGQPYISGY